VSESGGSVAGTLGIGAEGGICWAREKESEAPLRTKHRPINCKRQDK